MVKWRTFALIATFFAVLLSLVLIYQLIYLKRVRDHVGSEQLAARHGVVQRRVTSNCAVWWIFSNKACYNSSRAKDGHQYSLWMEPRSSWN